MSAPVVRFERGSEQSGHFLQPSWNGSDSIRERYEAVRPFLSGSVLDVGCASRYRRPDWLHGLLAADFKDVVGIDLNAAVVEELRGAGHDVHLGDARDFDLGRRFDVVLAGELIEHLDDVRGFLTAARRHLEPRGRLVLTTPNAFYVGNFVYRFGGHARVHPEHTGWYCADTLRRVLSVNGFGDVDIYFTGHRSLTPLRRAATWTARHLLPPALANDTLIAVARVGADDHAAGDNGQQTPS